jgi:hypothetical protein
VPGAIGFWPALHPQASSIDLTPTTTAARAVIHVPLAYWLDRLHWSTDL